MAKCYRNGVKYKRHNYKQGRCVHCSEPQYYADGDGNPIVIPLFTQPQLAVLSESTKSAMLEGFQKLAEEPLNLAAEVKRP